MLNGELGQAEAERRMAEYRRLRGRQRRDYNGGLTQLPEVAVRQLRHHAAATCPLCKKCGWKHEVAEPCP